LGAPYRRTPQLDSAGAAIRIDHLTDQGFKSDVRLPSEVHLRLCGIAEQEIHFHRTKKIWIGHNIVPIVPSNM